MTWKGNISIWSKHFTQDRKKYIHLHFYQFLKNLLVSSNYSFWNSGFQDEIKWLISLSLRLGTTLCLPLSERQKYPQERTYAICFIHLHTKEFSVTWNNRS